MPKPNNLNRVCFWIPKQWRRRLLAILLYDGRQQSELLRTAAIAEIEKAEARIARSK